MKFALDTPAGDALDATTRFSGWCLDGAGRPADRVLVRVDGVDAVQLERTPRRDVAAAFPQFGEAAHGGFAGDVALDAKARRGARIDVEVIAEAGGRAECLLRRRYRVVADAPAAPQRLRGYRLEDVLEDAPSVASWDAVRGGRIAWPATILGVAHFHDAGALPTLRVLEAGPTNAYSSGALAVMDAVPAAGVFVDLGCGIRRAEDVRANGLYLDAVHFRGVDAVSTRARLPLRDASVDAVVSLGVFEHLPDPVAMAAEILRVLKPGGAVWIETAFMQPLHADPSHYFNMTEAALLRVFGAFAIDEHGVLEHQLPTFGLKMQLETALASMREGDWKATLAQWLERLRRDGAALNEALGPIARRSLAAGVYLRGRKPARLPHADAARKV